MPMTMTRSPWYSTSTALRKRKPVTLTLSDEARDILDRLGKQHGSRSEAVVQLLLAQAELTEEAKET